VRILWHGIGPWHKTGYGLQTGLFAPRLRDLGHEVVIAVMGDKAAKRHPLNHPDAAETRRTGRWDGMRVIGPGVSEFALPARAQVLAAFGGAYPHVVIVLKDAWVLRPADYRQYRTLIWLAFDTEPLGLPDRGFFAAAPGARAVCVSLRGRELALAAGLSGALYVPSVIDTGFWTPGSRQSARDALGLPHGAFIAGINAANIGPRKGWGEQLAAFAAFRQDRQDALLLIHTAPEHPEGISLRDLAAHLGITGAVLFGEHVNMRPEQMLSWYRSLDVLMMGSYGEGFGLPIAEAMACGIPVVGTDCSAISEKIPPGAGWLVKGQRWWNPHHRAWWTIPSVTGLTAALGHAAAGHHDPPQAIREHALAYDADHVTKTHWAPLLEEMS
jgi:glycosyltransferase involved in cell wall biosynthesis